MFRNLAVLSIYSTFEACNRSYDIKQILNSKFKTWNLGPGTRARGTRTW